MFTKAMRAVTVCYANHPKKFFVDKKMAKLLPCSIKYFMTLVYFNVWVKEYRNMRLCLVILKCNYCISPTHLSK